MDNLDSDNCSSNNEIITKEHNLTDDEKELNDLICQMDEDITPTLYIKIEK